MEDAATNGSVEVLIALKPWPIRLTGAFTAAAAHGQIHVLEMFFDHQRVNNMHYFGVSAALEEAAERGNCAAI